MHTGTYCTVVIYTFCVVCLTIYFFTYFTVIKDALPQCLASISFFLPLKMSRIPSGQPVRPYWDT